MLISENRNETAINDCTRLYSKFRFDVIDVKGTHEHTEFVDFVITVSQFNSNKFSAYPHYAHIWAAKKVSTIILSNLARKS